MNDVHSFDIPPHRFTSLRILCICLLALILSPATTFAANSSDGSTLAKKNVVQQAEMNGVDVHEQFFSDQPYEGTASCLQCHEEAGTQMLDSGHFKWAGKVENIDGLEGMILGKRDLINNFCIATDTNEARCTQCHVGYGWKDNSYDFTDPENVDCLVCHDQSGTDRKSV